MQNIAVQKKADAAEPICALFEDTNKLFQQLQERAFHMFEDRGASNGKDIDDWLRAEHEMFEMPPSELTEDETMVHLKAAVAGMKAENLEVRATPRQLVIRGKEESEAEREEGKSHIREFSHKQVYRQYDLPAEVEVDKITASLSEGMLMVEMPKAPNKQIPVTESKPDEATKAA